MVLGKTYFLVDLVSVGPDGSKKVIEIILNNSLFLKGKNNF